MWYRVIQNPQELHGLTGCQQYPGFWGVTIYIMKIVSFEFSFTEHVVFNLKS